MRRLPELTKEEKALAESRARAYIEGCIAVQGQMGYRTDVPQETIDRAIQDVACVTRLWMRVAKRRAVLPQDMEEP